MTDELYICHAEYKSTYWMLPLDCIVFAISGAFGRLSMLPVELESLP